MSLDTGLPLQHGSPTTVAAFFPRLSTSAGSSLHPSGAQTARQAERSALTLSASLSRSKRIPVVMTSRERPYKGIDGTGPSYTLAGSSTKFQLPASAQISRTDGLTGELDVWPAGVMLPKRGVTGADMSAGSLVVDEKFKARPKFLSELEHFVETELANLGISSGGPSEERLQVYRECFQYLMEDFKTYKPLLSAIKNEYELLIEKYQVKLQTLPSLKARLSTIKNETNQLVSQLQNEHAELIAKLQQELEDTKGTFEGLRREKEEAKQENVTLSAEVKRFREKYHDMHEQNYTLVKHMRHYQELIDDMKRNEQIQEHLKNQLRSSLSEAQVDMSRLQQEVDELRMKLSVMVPREDHELMKAELDKTKSDLHSLKLAYSSLMDEYKSVSTLYQDVAINIQYQGEQRQRNSQASRPMTPRPNWQSIQSDMKHKLDWPSTGSTDETVQFVCGEMDKLYKEMNDFKATFGFDFDDDSNPAEVIPEFFVGKTGAHVPKFLQFSGKIRNKKIPKRDVELIIQDCWQSKLKEAPNTPLPEYFYNFLKKKHGIQSMIAEVGYSMMDALKRYSYAPDPMLFLLCLNGEIHEDVVLDQQQVMADLDRRLTALDRKNNFGKLSGKLTKKELIREVILLIPGQSEHHLNVLRKALASQSEGAVVEYRQLLEQDREMNYSVFITQLRKQHIADIQEYTTQLEELIRSRDLGSGITTISTLREALKTFDPYKPDNEVDKILARGAGLSVENLSQANEVPIDKFILVRRLVLCVIVCIYEYIFEIDTSIVIVIPVARIVGNFSMFCVAVSYITHRYEGLNQTMQRMKQGLLKRTPLRTVSAGRNSTTTSRESTPFIFRDSTPVPGTREASPFEDRRESVHDISKSPALLTVTEPAPHSNH